MNVPFLGRAIDERFLNHRLRSTSMAGIVGAVVAMSLFLYRYYTDHVWSWDLLAVGVTIAVVKVALMTWYFLTD
jgi:ABC-type cobalamin transport system permease subunit